MATNREMNEEKIDRVLRVLWAIRNNDEFYFRTYGKEYLRFELQDSERIDWLQKIILPKENYCEVYLSGLRHAGHEATMFQVESNPQVFKTIGGDTLREAIDAARGIKTYKKEDFNGDENLY